MEINFIVTFTTDSIGYIYNIQIEYRFIEYRYSKQNLKKKICKTTHPNNGRFAFESYIF